MSFQSAVLQDFLFRWIPELMPDIMEWLPRFFLLVILCPTGTFHSCKCVSFSTLWICISEQKGKTTAYKLSFYLSRFFLLLFYMVSTWKFWGTHLRICWILGTVCLFASVDTYSHGTYNQHERRLFARQWTELSCSRRKKNIDEIYFVLGREEKGNIWCLRNCISDFAR